MPVELRGYDKISKLERWIRMMRTLDLQILVSNFDFHVRGWKIEARHTKDTFSDSLIPEKLLVITNLSQKQFAYNNARR